MPVWTHLLLLVGEQQQETETERDKREKGDVELKWHCNLALARAVCPHRGLVFYDRDEDEYIFVA